VYQRFCQYKDDAPKECLKESKLDLTLLIDTSGKQVSRLGDKKRNLENFIRKLFGEFENKELLKLSVVLFGDYRSGQVQELISPAEHLTEEQLDEKLKDFKWYELV